MAEQIKESQEKRGEQEASKEQGAGSKEVVKNLEKQAEQLAEKAEKAAEQSQEKQAEQAREKVEKLAESGEKHKPNAGEKKPKHKATRGIKKQTYKATMKRIEARLPAYQKAFSKVINQPTIDRVSNVAGKTIARPSGVMGGGIFAFLGVAVVYFYARKIGFPISGTEFVLFLGIGWVAGILVEILYKTFKRVVK